MAEFNIAEKLNIELAEIARTDVMTGDRDKRMYLYYQLVNSIKTATQIDIIVSFLMESGVRMLLKELNRALNRGAHVRILTGNYLGITQPSALYLIKRWIIIRGGTTKNHENFSIIPPPSFQTVHLHYQKQSVPQMQSLLSHH